MASFNNACEVNSQVAHQQVHGDINHYHIDNTLRAKRLRLEQDDFDLEKSLDDDILTSLAFPEMFYRRGDVPMPYQTTCRWIFDLKEYTDWTSQQSGLLWIKGKPGAGKSTVMAHLYQAIRQQCSNGQGLCIEFFFTARGVLLQRVALGMLRSLLSQIFQHDVHVRSILRRSYREKQQLFGSGPRVWEWRQPELEKLLIEAILTLAPRRPLIVFIDALDEIGKTAAQELAHYFHDLNDRLCCQSAMAKICISCRHFPVIPKFGAAEIWVERHNQSDIATYVRGRLNIQNLLSDGMFERTEWEALVQNLIDAANGVFQWVCLVVPRVVDLILGGDSPERIRQWLTQVPEELGQVYKQIFERLLAQSHKTQSCRLFQWVCFVTRPLDVKEMRYALSNHNITNRSLLEEHQDTDDSADTDELMKLRIRSWSGGLIETKSYSGNGSALVQPIHQSVNDFCLAEGLEILTRLDSPRPNSAPSIIARHLTSEIVASCHSELYWCCLNYMSEEILHFMAQHHEDSLFASNCQVMQKFPFFRYAASNCLIHAKAAQGYGGEDLAEEARLLETAISIWVRTQVKHNRIIDGCLEPNTTALHVAAAADLAELAQHLLECGVDVDAVDDRGQTALHIAARQGHLATAKLLTKNNADILKRTTALSTPLDLAAREAQVEVFTWLLTQDADHNVSDNSLQSAFLAAVCGGSTVITRLCIQAGAEVNIYDKRLGNVLQAASARGDMDIAQILLDAGAEVNAEGGLFGTALLAASALGHEILVQILLKAGADVNNEGGRGGSPLYVASGENQEEIMQMLIKAGADVNASGGYYGNALQMASSTANHEREILMLLEAGADVHAQGGHYGNALQAASKGGIKKIVQTLLEAGADVNAQGGFYGNALQAASHHGNKDVVEMLLEAGADVNAQGGEYGNALMAASCAGHKGVAKILLRAGAEIDALGEHRDRVVQLARRRGWDKVKKVLFQADAELNAERAVESTVPSEESG